MRRAVAERVRLILAVLGAGISVYLILVHYDSHVALACVESGIIDCVGVLTSPQSEWFHIPVAAFGLLWFVVAGTLAALALRSPDRAALQTWGLIWVEIGAATVVFLVYEELIVIGRICMWCTLVHIIVLTSLVLAISSGGRAAPQP